MGEKPSSTGASTAWASAGRPVDWYTFASFSAACRQKLRAPCSRATAMAARKATSASAGSAGLLFDEDFAANAVQSAVEPMLSGLARQRERAIDSGKSGFRVSPVGFDFREQPLIERQKQSVASAGVVRQRLSKLGGAGTPIAELRARPGQRQCCPDQIGSKTVLPAERDKCFRGAPSRFGVVTEDFE